MRLLISGSSGLIGAHLTKYLSSHNFEILRVVRSKDSGGQSVFWNPNIQFIENSQLLEDFDVAVNLSGENIVGRWTKEKKRRIRDSRINSTKLLVDTFSRLKNRPKCFICASAIGFYGDRGDEELFEDSVSDEGYLSDICKDWEQEANRAIEYGIRVVNLRIGVVLSKEGGALGQMLKVFKLGLGGVVGDGKQYWSWISIEDISRIIKYISENENISGAVNAVSPNPVNNREFTKTLGYALNRPTLFKAPAFAIKLLFGEMGEHGILASAKVLPKKLLDNGYNFHHPDLKSALEDILKK